MRVTPYVLIGAFLLAGVTARAETGPVTGRFQGTGRACHGTLAVHADSISWQTPFSQCKSMAYDLIEQDAQKSRTRMTYRFKSHSGSCRFTILSLTHSGRGQDTGWEVTGYGSEQSYRSDKSSGYKTNAEDMMSCYLIRDPGK